MENYVEDIRKDFLKFCCYIHPNFELPSHVVKVGRILNDFVHGDRDKLIITMPPRAGKSFLCSESLPPYILGLNPQLKILTATYGYELSKIFAGNVIDTIEDSKFKKIFPNATLLNTGTSSNIWKTSAGGYYKCSTRGGALTGLSGNIIIVDDILKNSTEAASRSLLKGIEKWFDSTLYSRLTVGPNGEKPKILILMTRWTKQDLVGHILKNDIDKEWIHINIPAIDDEGEAIWEEKQPLKFLLEIKSRDPALFNCLYQGRPNEDGASEFELEKYIIMPETYENKITGGYRFSSWDTASKISDANDFTVGTLWTVYKKKLYLEDFSQVKKTMPELYSHILDKAEEWETKYNLIEDTSSGIGLLQLYDANKKKIKRKFIPTSANVKKKLSVVFPLLEAGDVILKRFPELMTEMSEYPGGEHDDFVASIVNAIWYFCTQIKNKDIDSTQSKDVVTSISKRKVKNFLLY